MNWTVEGRGDTFAIVDQDDVEVATVPYTAETGDDPLNTAEGRRAVLLSVAPEMLSALEAMLEAPDDNSRYNAAIDARTAIRNAKGGQ